MARPYVRMHPSNKRTGRARDCGCGAALANGLLIGRGPQAWRGAWSQQLVVFPGFSLKLNSSFYAYSGLQRRVQALCPFCIFVVRSW